jgi:hypothetical protein
MSDGWWSPHMGEIWRAGVISAAISKDGKHFSIGDQKGVGFSLDLDEIRKLPKDRRESAFVIQFSGYEAWVVDRVLEAARDAHAFDTPADEVEDAPKTGVLEFHFVSGESIQLSKLTDTQAENILTTATSENPVSAAISIKEGGKTILVIRVEHVTHVARLS